MDAFEVVSVNSANAIGKPSQVHLLGKLEALYHAPVAADVVAARDRGRRPVLSCGIIQQQTILSVYTSVQSWYGAERSTVGGQRRDYMG